MIVESHSTRKTQGVGHGTKVACQQRDVGRFHRDVGSARECDSEIRLCKRGGVVDAVADHCNHLTLTLQIGDELGLLVRKYASDHLVDSDCAAHGLSRRRSYLRSRAQV